MRSALLLSLALLAACASNPRVGTASGGVKVGKPYQIAGKWYHPKDDADYDEKGIASWYGPGFHAKATATGETYDQDALTAAHKTLPMPSYVEVTNLDNGRRATLRINDRGPFVDKRIIDLSRRSAQLLGVDKAGLAKVRVKRVHLNEREIARLGLLPNTRGRGQQQAVQVAVAAPPPMPVPMPQRIVIPPRQIVVTPPPAAVMVPPGALFVQVAALSDRVRAATLATALESLATPNIEATATGLFRVRLGPFADAASAAKVLDELQAAGYSDARVVGLPVS